MHPDANRTQVKQAVETLFDVQVQKVNIVNQLGKIKRQGMTSGRRASVKESLCHAEERFQGHRILRRHGAVSRLIREETDHGYQEIQADFAGPPWHDGDRLQRFDQDRARALAAAGSQKVRRPQRARPDYRPPSRRRQQRQYRIIDFKRNKDGIPAKVATLEYDPNRTAFIALLHYADGEKRYILAPIGLKVGDKVLSGPEADIIPGNCLPIRNIPLGTIIHNIELIPGKGGQMCRTAGPPAQLMARRARMHRSPALGRGAHGPHGRARQHWAGLQ